jgi:hypothetical protein
MKKDTKFEISSGMVFVRSTHGVEDSRRGLAFRPVDVDVSRPWSRSAKCPCVQAIHRVTPSSRGHLRGLDFASLAPDAALGRRQ